VPWVESAETIEPPLAVVTAHVTPLLPESLARTAVKVAVAFVQPVFWGKILDELPVTLVIEIGCELLPQAIRNPASTSIRHIPAMVAPLDILRPAKPTITTPARGKVSGSQGRRLSERWRNVLPVPLFGPLVLMVIVTVDALDPAAIVADGLKAQLLLVRVGSAGEKEVQLRFTALTNVDPEVGVAKKL
jgi:hypothetical protein